MNFKREAIQSENIIERENGKMHYFIMKSEKDIFDMAESEEILSIEISNTSDILINIIR